MRYICAAETRVPVLKKLKKPLCLTLALSLSSIPNVLVQTHAHAQENAAAKTLPVNVLFDDVMSRLSQLDSDLVMLTRRARFPGKPGSPLPAPTHIDITQ